MCGVYVKIDEKVARGEGAATAALARSWIIYIYFFSLSLSLF